MSHRALTQLPGLLIKKKYDDIKCFIALLKDNRELAKDNKDLKLENEKLSLRLTKMDKTFDIIRKSTSKESVGLIEKGYFNIDNKSFGILKKRFKKVKTDDKEKNSKEKEAK